MYSIQSNGARWHENFSDNLRNMGFSPYKAEPDIWMIQLNELWEYITVYVDDFDFFVRDPKAIINLLEEKYNYKLKDTCSISYHLGCDFFRDNEDVLCMAPKK